MIVPVSEKFAGYARAVCDELFSADVLNGSLGYRVEVDVSSERMQKKVRNAIVGKIPIILVVGGAEEASNSVSVRTREGADYGQVELAEFLGVLREAVERRDDAKLHARYASA